MKANGGGELILKNGAQVPDEVWQMLGNVFTEVADSPDGGIWMTIDSSTYYDEDDTELALKMLAPYVKSGEITYDMDDSKWAYQFENGRVYYADAVVTYVRNYELKQNVLEAKCACCGRIGKHYLTNYESATLDSYRIWGRKLGMIQDLFPKIPAWIRSGAIDQMCGGFCICPECQKEEE